MIMMRYCSICSSTSRTSDFAVVCAVGNSKHKQRWRRTCVGSIVAEHGEAPRNGGYFTLGIRRESREEKNILLGSVSVSRIKRKSKGLLGVPDSDIASAGVAQRTSAGCFEIVFEHHSV